MASNSATVAPLFAARVAPILRTPCADFATPAALQASLNKLPNDSLVRVPPFSPQMKARSAHGPACRTPSRTGRIGMVTVTPVFSVLSRYAVADMLAAEVHRIAPTQSGVEQHGQPNAFLGADGPTFFVLLHIVLGPHRKPGSLWPRRIFYAGRGIGPDVAGIESPAKQTAHRIEKIPGLRRCISPAVTTGNDVLTLDRGCLFMAGLVEHAAHDVFALASGCERKRGPCRRFAVSFPQPLKGADRRFLLASNGRAVESCSVLRFKFGRAEYSPDAYPRPMTVANVPGGHAVATFFAMQMWWAWSRHGL
jgi:hypothetical protein